MADLKISELTNLTAADPANDMIPIVDVSATPPASGSTKRISINNILACSPTATLASATISGDLTVDTSTLKVDSANDRVGVGTASPAVRFNIADSDNAANGTIRLGVGAIYSQIKMAASSTGATEFTNVGNGVNGAYNFSIDGQNQYKIATSGVFSWYDGAGGTRMTLNSTGLGVGGSPTSKLSIFAGADGDVGFFRGGSTRQLQIGTSATAGYLNADNGSAGFELRVNGTARAYFDTSGNVGIGVTPSAWNSSYRGLQLGAGGAISAHTSASLPWLVATSNSFINSAGDWKFINNGYSTRYLARGDDGTQSWWTSNNGSAGGTVAYTQAMTLESTGSLVLGAAAVATTATDGFLYIPGCAGTPTGTPTAKTGRVPLVVDTTNNKLYFYSGGAWVAAN